MPLVAGREELIAMALELALALLMLLLLLLIGVGIVEDRPKAPAVEIAAPMPPAPPGPPVDAGVDDKAAEEPKPKYCPAVPPAMGMGMPQLVVGPVMSATAAGGDEDDEDGDNGDRIDTSAANAP